MCLYFHQDRNARWILGTMYGDEWKEICPYCVNSDFMPFALTWMVTKMGECPESCSWNCETMDDHRHSGTIRRMQHSRHLVPNLGWQSTNIIHTEMLPVNPMTLRVSWHIGRRWIRSEKNTSMYLFMVLIPLCRRPKQMSWSLGTKGIRGRLVRKMVVVLNFSDKVSRVPVKKYTGVSVIAPNKGSSGRVENQIELRPFGSVVLLGKVSL